ncbi:hypothetical protein [Lewinella sp. IMCC34191]|uniref:hypothetical protein n=1 Tax=Lewinella sp. IMCC34191 TaxID=2259172 RepID=UPI000E24B781|nr:hypothetical protein [Lewinella sp. IMCC34191]
MSEAQLLQACRKRIEQQLGWGPSEQWTNDDFLALSERIGERTSVSLSPTTLKRLWGRVAYSSSPSTTTLDALARFAGFDHWRHFRSSIAPETPTRHPTIEHFSWLVPSLAVAVILALILSFALPAVDRTAGQPDGATASVRFTPADFAFDLQPVAGGIPNSVIFKYDATAAGDSAVYLQQSWDPSRRELLDPAGDTHTSIYYLPGFFRAKLVVGSQIVQERELFLPSGGWIAAVAGENSPVYLKPSEARQEGQLAFTPQALERYGIPLEPNVPSTTLVNVREMDGLRTDDFTFRTRFRHTYAEGSSVCQRTWVTLMLKDGAIRLPFSAPGCVADLSAYVGGQSLNGQTTDLSVFGVMGPDWTELAVTGKGDSLFVRVNDRSILRLGRQEEVRDIIGLQYDFKGTGAVDAFSFYRNEDVIWAEAF